MKLKQALRPRFFSLLSLPTTPGWDTYASDMNWGRWITGISHPQCKSDHGGHMRVYEFLGGTLPRAIWNGNKSSCVGCCCKEGYSIFPAYEPPTKQSETICTIHYILNVCRGSLLSVQYCCVVKALYWIIFMKFVWVFTVKGWKSFFTPPSCLSFDGYLWQYTTCSWMD
jgi:hypothetical protein